MITREQIIKFIPEPKNEEVIVYNIDLKDLLNVDVLDEYYKLLPIFLSKKEAYSILDRKIKEYNNTINNIYLFNKSWSEEDYLIKLRNDKKTYSTMYNEIKTLENNIKITEKKIDAINEKIKIQDANENREVAKRLDNINIDIEMNKKQLLNIEDKINYYQPLLKIVDKDIAENEEEFSFLSDMQEHLQKGNYKCKYCGSTVKVVSENSLIYKRLEKNLIDNKKELEILLEKKKKIELEISYYEKERSKVKNELSNNIEFRKGNNLYTKKSLEILKLEALRDELLNNMSEYKKRLTSHSALKSDRYKELKDNIDKCELSLENLKKIHQIKNEMQDLVDTYKESKENLIQTFNTIKKYVEYLSIYFKIYEQKLNEFFGKDYKFKLASFDDNMEIKEILKIQYKGIDYLDLSEKEKNEVDEALALKISLFD